MCNGHFGISKKRGTKLGKKNFVENFTSSPVLFFTVRNGNYKGFMKRMFDLDTFNNSRFVSTIVPTDLRELRVRKAGL